MTEQLNDLSRIFNLDFFESLPESLNTENLQVDNLFSFIVDTIDQPDVIYRSLFPTETLRRVAALDERRSALGTSRQHLSNLFVDKFQQNLTLLPIIRVTRYL